MTVGFSYKGIQFTWNEKKSQTNMNKHQISFQEAVEAFFDPFVRFMDASQNNEQRDAIVGKTENHRLLYVVHIQFENDSIRIISARHATKTEENYYYEAFRP